MRTCICGLFYLPTQRGARHCGRYHAKPTGYALKYANCVVCDKSIGPDKRYCLVCRSNLRKSNNGAAK